MSTKKKIGVGLLLVVGSMIAYARWTAVRKEQSDAAGLAKARFNIAAIYARGYPNDRDFSTSSIKAEVEFMFACRECAPAVACERDRLSIRAGTASSTYNPCE